MKIIKTLCEKVGIIFYSYEKSYIIFLLKEGLENCQKTYDILMSMKGKVEMLKDIQVGIDFLHSERSYDIILETLLADENALDAYQNDPYHCDVVKKHMHAVRESSIAIDYYIEEKQS